MPLVRNKPLPTDILSDSQADLLNNNNAIDTSFGTDHFAASNLTANNGLHNTVTTVAQSSAAPTTSANPIFYGFADATPPGVLQYSRGPNNAVPSPLTTVQSSSSGIPLGSGATQAIMNFMGVPYCYGYVYFAAVPNNVLIPPFLVVASFFWQGAVPGIVNNIVNTGFAFSGTTLQFTNGSAAVSKGSFTLEFKRIFTPL